MIQHNLAIAWQQLVKYRLQSVVSIVSLAIGFACFALASMWIKYETTYDAFHKDAENIHVITMENDYMLRHYYMNIRALQEIPELGRLTHVTNNYPDSINGIRHPLYNTRWLMNDTNFVNLFGLDILEGSTSFVHNEHEVAISDQFAKLCKDGSPIGKQLTLLNTYKGLRYEQTLTVAAVFRSWGEHSNFHFHLLSRKPADIPEDFCAQSHIMAHVSPKVDIQKLNAKLDTIRFINDKWAAAMSKDEYLGYIRPEERPKLVPLTELYHSNWAYENYSKFKLSHIHLFSIACILLISCALLNYLTMFINRLFIRKREIALRTVFGATGRDLMLQFITEYGLLLLIALLLGLFITFGLMEDFLTLADLRIGRYKHFHYTYTEVLPEIRDFFIQEILWYILLVFAISLLVSVPFIWYFRRQSLQSSITGTGGLARYNRFRYISTTLQMGISIFCIFCTVVLLKQLDTLRHGDIGFERENRIVWHMSNNYQDKHEEVISFLRSCPEIDTLIRCSRPIYPYYSSSRITLLKKDFPDLLDNIQAYRLDINKEVADFYGLTLLQGRWPNDDDKSEAVVNEAFVHQSGWREPLGKKLHWGQKIVGVVKDFHNISPLTKSEPYILPNAGRFPRSGRSIIFRYHPGMKQALKEKAETFFKERELPFKVSDWEYLTETYGRMLRSEDNLRQLLFITTGVCILIALFGVWSMIMLTCEQRRKEIAVRKVFGATTKDILDMFFAEYMALQVVAASVAFPIGYACMKPWLEQYVVQTSIPWWIYIGIFLLVALLVALCIGWRVWKTASASPADEICKG